MSVKSSPLRLIHDCSDPLHIVVLVHGTWAMNAKWTRSGSALINEVLSVLCPQSVAIYARDWSGRNSVRQRYMAAAVLKNDLKDIGSRFPRATLHVVGHSHGGNVAAKAIGDMGSPRIGLACLSTPFLRARHRRAGAWSAKIIVSNISFLLFQSALILPSYFIVFGHFKPKHPHLFNYAATLVAFWLFHTHKFLSVWLPTVLKRVGSRFSLSVNFLLDPATPLLLIKMTDDEAGGLLTTYRFLDWVMDRYLAFVRKIVVLIKMSNHRRPGNIFYYGFRPRWRRLRYVRTLSVLLGLGFFLYFLIHGVDDAFGRLAVIMFVVVYFVLLTIIVVLGSIAFFAMIPLGWSAILGIFTRTGDSDEVDQHSAVMPISVPG